MLNLSQSAFSTHIAKLEKEVGAELVDRSSQTIDFTPAGRDLLETASVMLDAYDAFLARTAAGRKNGSQRITVMSVPHVDTATFMLLKRIRDFKDTHPDVLVDVRESLEYDMAECIRKGTIDCGFDGLHLQAPSNDDGIDDVPLAHEEFMVWVDRNSPLALKENLEPRDLLNSTVPLWSGLSNDLETLYREFFSTYGVDVQYSDRFSASREDFFLNHVRPSDIVLLTHGCEHINAIRVRDDRTLVRFDPPIQATSYIAFGAGRTSDACAAFKNYLVAHSDDE
jgi:DNA-binding transcriptional LysR family regulator